MAFVMPTPQLTPSPHSPGVDYFQAGRPHQGQYTFYQPVPAASQSNQMAQIAVSAVPQPAALLSFPTTVVRPLPSVPLTPPVMQAVHVLGVPSNEPPSTPGLPPAALPASVSASAAPAKYPEVIPAKLLGAIVPAEKTEAKPPPKRQNAKPTKTKPAAAKPPTYDDRDHIRPCNHNTWEKEGKKRGRLVLRCVQEDCRMLWKTRPECHEKCDDFYMGECLKGGDCPHPHIYANARRPHSKQVLLAINRRQGAQEDNGTVATGEDETETLPSTAVDTVTDVGTNGGHEGMTQGRTSPFTDTSTQVCTEVALSKEEATSSAWFNDNMSVSTTSTFATKKSKSRDKSAFRTVSPSVPSPRSAAGSYRHDPGYGDTSSETHTFFNQGYQYPESPFNDTQPEQAHQESKFVPYQFQEPQPKSVTAVVDGTTVPGPQGSAMVFSNGKWQWMFVQAGEANPEDVVASGAGESMRYNPNHDQRPQAQTPPADVQGSPVKEDQGEGSAEYKVGQKQEFVTDQERLAWFEDSGSFLHRGRIRTV